MSNHPPRTGHHAIAEIRFPVRADSSLLCTCGTLLSAPTPELVELEFGAHRKLNRAGESRPLGKVPGYTFGGAFK